MNTVEDADLFPDEKNARMKRETRVPIAGAILAGLFGGLGPYMGAVILFPLGWLSGAPEAGSPEDILHGLLLVSLAPAAVILGASGRLETPPSLGVTLLSNALMWAGLGSLLHAALLHMASKRRRFRVRGKFIGAILLVLGAVIISCFARQPSSDDSRSIKTDTRQETRKAPCERLVSRRAQVAIDGSSFELTRKRVGGNWLFPSYAKDLTGRQNRLIGSRVVTLSYQSDPPLSRITVVIEGSLFTPEETYSYSQEGKLSPGVYLLRAKSGKHLRLRLIDQLEYESCDSGGLFSVPDLSGIEIFP